MRYVSTRGQAPVRDFAGVLLAGLAEDGGLYVPQTWPSFSAGDWRAMRGLPYAELAARVMQPFVGESVSFATLQKLCHESYAGFTHPAVAPLVQLDSGLWAQELFHGPTLAFKDMALQLLGRLFDEVLARRGSGSLSSARPPATPARLPSTPSPAAARVDIVILHPHGRTSEVQRRQMTTVAAGNVGNIAVDGSFDDCQDLVKAMFAGHGVPRRDEPLGGELDQLGPGGGAGAVLRRRRPGAGCAGPRGGVRGADRQFRQRPRRLGGAPDGPADRAADLSPPTATTS